MYMEKFKTGDQVIVTNSNLQSYGLIGTVTCCGAIWDTAYVKFENWRGRGSKELCFRKSNISKNLDQNKIGENVMAVKGDYRVAMVKFVQGTNTTKGYAFALFDEDICEGHHVLCDTANGFGVAQVVSIVDQNEYDGTPITKEIICKVDFTAFEKRKELRKQKELLKKQMDKMVADNQELILYQAIADKNPEMAELLAAYRSLSAV